MLITVFTPTYNRAYRLNVLYESLCRQSFTDFEWLIVDDGSTDNTEALVEDWLKENKINIRYFRQPNGGKHRAINQGVKMANGELFFIVDSDDCLTPNAIDEIERQYRAIYDKEDFCGVCGLKCYADGSKIGGESKYDILECSSLDFRYKYKVKGDMAEVLRTDILRNYPFPEFDDEKFCPEALVWNRIALKYKFRYFYSKIYVCEYLSDGLTAGIVRIRRNSPKASMLYYSELYHLKINLKTTIKASINFWRFSSGYKATEYKMSGLLSQICLPLGKLMRGADVRKL